jgi:hypothetical protein
MGADGAVPHLITIRTTPSYFIMTYFIIKDTLIIIYLFYNLHKLFE